MAPDEESIGLDTDELPRARDACSYIADSRLLKRLAVNEHNAGGLLRQHPFRTYVGTLPFHLEPSDWRAGYLKIRELDPSQYWLIEMGEVSPQALLRDLYRPIRESFVWYEREVQVALDRGGAEAMAEARTARKREPLPVVVPLVREMLQHRDHWRGVVRKRWEPIYPDSEPRKKVHVYRDASMNW